MRPHFPPNVCVTLSDTQCRHHCLVSSMTVKCRGSQREAPSQCLDCHVPQHLFGYYNDNDDHFGTQIKFPNHRRRQGFRLSAVVTSHVADSRCPKRTERLVSTDYVLLAQAYTVVRSHTQTALHTTFLLSYLPSGSALSALL
jgi:hypothetical protein